MISLHMQGGCLCENPPGLRLETTNVEIAATIAPRPLLMVAATGDWTKNTLAHEYPAVRDIYGLLGAAERVETVQFDAPHNYHRESREAVYAWMARWLQGAPADVQRPERSFNPGSLADLLVFHMRPLPPGAVTPSELTHNWIAAAERQIASTSLDVRGRALRHALGFGAPEPDGEARRPADRRRAVILAAEADAERDRLSGRAGLAMQPVAFTPFDAVAAEAIRHFDTYNRTAASQRVADIVTAVRANPGAPVVAEGDAALAALLASAVEPPPAMILDVGDFDTSSDAAFVERLYVPGLRRAGDLATAAALYRGRLVIHNAGDRFVLDGTTVRRDRLAPREIVEILRQAP
jgi:hypothetical protein